METFIEKEDLKFSKQTGTFKDNIDTYTSLLSLDSTKVNQVKKDHDNFKYVLAGVDRYNVYTHSVVAQKQTLRFGKVVTNVINIVQPNVWLPVIPVDMAEGCQFRFSDIIQDAVRSGKLTQAIGEALGIVKPVTPFVPADGTPDAKGHLTSGGVPILGATIGQYHGYVIYKDNGTGAGYKRYDKSDKHDWIDHLEALPPLGTSKVWKYKLIYWLDAEVGHFSSEVIVTVYGNV